MGQDQPETWPPGQYPAGGPWPTAPGAPPTTVPPPRQEPAWGQTPTVPGPGEFQQSPAQWAPEQTWTGAPQQPPPQPPGIWSRAMVLAVSFAVVVLLAGGGVGWWLWHRSTEQPPVNPVASNSQPGPAHHPGPTSAPAGGLGGGATAARTSPTAASRTTPPSQPTPDPQAQALAQLTQLRQQSLGRVVLDGRWVAQVASKSVGITDPLQTAQNGTHTFYATDILAESLAARNLVSDPSQVYVLWGTDFGKRSQAPDGNPYWVTVVDAGFGSSATVQQWCQSSFPTLNPQQLADTCAPRQLSPPHN